MVSCVCGHLKLRLNDLGISGFNAYVSLLEVENAQTNPILLTFVDLLRGSAGGFELESVEIPVPVLTGNTVLTISSFLGISPF